VAKLVEEQGAEMVAALYLKSGHPADEAELRSARALADELGIHLEVIDVTDVVDKLGGGALTRHAGGVLTDFGTAIMGSIAIAYGMRRSADLICIGLHKDDADAGRQYTEGFLEALSNVARDHGLAAPRLHAPLIAMRKPEIVALGSRLGVDFASTWSCIVSASQHCGLCEACKARDHAFIEIGLTDPAPRSSRPSEVA